MHVMRNCINNLRFNVILEQRFYSLSLTIEKNNARDESLKTMIKR